MTATAKPAPSAPATSAPVPRRPKTGPSPPRWRSRRRATSSWNRAIRPGLPQDPRLLRLHHHREDQAGHESEAIRDYGKNIEKAIARLPDGLAVAASCTTCAGCCSTSARTRYFMYQGIFDTDFDKYTEDAVALFTQVRHQHGLREPRRLPRGLEDEPAGVHQVRPRAPVPELPGVRRVPVRDAPTRSRRR